MRIPQLLLGLVQIALILPGIQSRCPYPRIKNGYIKRKPGNRIAFFCLTGYTRYGARITECEDNKWKSPPPICVAPGCPRVPSNPRRDMDYVHNEAVVIFICLDTFVLVGKATAYCDGENWSSPAPECQNPEDIESCDFEDGEFCGWKQDEMDDFDWSRQCGQTTTGRTGPDYDHTLGPTRLNGHYIYMESSAPRIPGHVARLLSPLYQPHKSGRCFRFWYHMKGPAGGNYVGSLSVSVRVYNGSQIRDDVLFTVRENQGPDWKEGHTFLYKTENPFRILLTATRQESYIGDIAVDDISLYECQGATTSTDLPATEMTSLTAEIETTEVTSLTAEMETTEMTSLITEMKTTEMTSLRMEMKTTELTTVKETSQLSSTNESTSPAGYDVTSTNQLTSSQLVTTTLTKIMTSSSTVLSATSTAPVSKTGNDVFDASTTSPSTAIHSKPTSDFPDTNKSISVVTQTEKLPAEVTPRSFDNATDNEHVYRYTSKPGVKQFVIQNTGAIHSVSFVVSLVLGIAVIVIGALIIAFIVHRIKKQTKHYTDNDFETMHTATYRKQSTDGLIL